MPSSFPIDEGNAFDAMVEYQSFSAIITAGSIYGLAIVAGLVKVNEVNCATSV
ncbi:MAG: hypothetical protein ACR2NU_06830 [Aeoliella sp.]